MSAVGVKMKAWVIAATLLAAPAAQAAEVRLIDEYMAICVATQNAPDATVAVAKTRGYSEVPVDLPPGVDAITGLVRQSNGKTWAVVVARLNSPPRGDAPGQIMSSCAVTGPDDGMISADAARRWAGMPAANMGEAKSEFFFFERSGKRTPIPGKDEAATLAALKSGGFGLLQIEGEDDRIAISLTNSKPAP